MKAKSKITVEQFFDFVLPSLGKFVRFTFVREIKQRTGIGQEAAEKEFDNALKSGRIELLYHAGGDGGVAVYEARKKFEQ